MHVLKVQADKDSDLYLDYNWQFSINDTTQAL